MTVYGRYRTVVRGLAMVGVGGLLSLSLWLVLREEPRSARAPAGGSETNDAQAAIQPGGAGRSKSATSRRAARKNNRSEVPPIDDVRFERGANEWQGMKAEKDDVWPCADGFCGGARACVAGNCVPCIADAECNRGELCVLGVCVLREKVGCQSREHCLSHELCVMNGFTPLDLRGNRDTVAYCLDPNGGREASREETEAEIARQREMAEMEASSSKRTDREGPVTPGQRALRILRSTASPGN